MLGYLAAWAASLSAAGCCAESHHGSLFDPRLRTLPLLALANRSLLVVYASLQQGQQEECPPTWQDLVAVNRAVQQRRPLEQSEVDCIDMRDAKRSRQTERIGTHHCVRRAIGCRHGHRRVFKSGHAAIDRPTRRRYKVTSTALFFSFYGGSWSFMLSVSIIFACFLCLLSRVFPVIHYDYFTAADPPVLSVAPPKCHPER